MRRSIFAALVAALLIVSPVLGRAGASITAPDGLSFGDTFSVTFTPPNHYSGALRARGECRANDTSLGVNVLWIQYASTEGTTAGPFTLGPTPSWLGGGADCIVALVSIDNNRYHLFAEDDFVVAP